MAGEAGSGGGDLGAMMPKEPNQPGNSWMDLLRSPFVQGAAQALASGNMTGGNTLREVLGSTAYGSQSEQLTEQNQYARKQEEQARQDKLSEGAANRKSMENRAEVSADARVNAANLRADTLRYLADKKYSINGAGDAKLHLAAQKAAATELDKTIKDAVGWPPDQRAAWISQRGQQIYDAAKVAGEHGLIGKLGGDGAGPDDGKPSPGGVNVGGAATAPPVKAATGAKGTPGILPFEEFIKKPGVQEQLQNPEFKARLANDIPDYAPYLRSGTGDTPMPQDKGTLGEVRGEWTRAATGWVKTNQLPNWAANLYHRSNRRAEETK